MYDTLNLFLLVMQQQWQIINMNLIAIIAEFEMNIGHSNEIVHFSLQPGARSTLRYDMMRKTNQKESRQNDAPAAQSWDNPRRFVPKGFLWNRASAPTPAATRAAPRCARVFL